MSETRDAGCASFAAFYPLYLEQHRDINCRRMHFVGTALVISTGVYALSTASWRAFALLPLFGYGCAWIGHLVFEKNRPATFKHPLYSLAGDFVMFRDMLIGKLLM